MYWRYWGESGLWKLNHLHFYTDMAAILYFGVLCTTIWRLLYDAWFYVTGRIGPTH